MGFERAVGVGLDPGLYGGAAAPGGTGVGRPDSEVWTGARAGPSCRLTRVDEGGRSGARDGAQGVARGAAQDGAFRGARDGGAS